jgi:hypothetical protein
LLKLPVLGNEEDSADQIAGFISLQFGDEVAQILINGVAHGWNWKARNRLSVAWGVHSSALQRQHTVLCLAYGRDPQRYQRFVDSNWLPKSRAANCAKEYGQMLMAFKKSILPHIDEPAMKRVQQRKWLQLGGAN